MYTYSEFLYGLYIVEECRRIKYVWSIRVVGFNNAKLIVYKNKICDILFMHVARVEWLI